MRSQEFLSEEEYDDGAGQFGQNPNMLKVNADQWLITNPVYRRNIGKGEMPLEEKKLWESRAIKLQDRAYKIFNQLKAELPPDERSALNAVKVWVPLDGEGRYAAANFKDGFITLDVGTYWDLSNDCLAYTIAHEIGHMIWAFGPQKNWNNPKIRNRQITPAQSRQEEMDADVFGALLAYRLGYDRRRAWDDFTIAMQRKPFNPAEPYYPSVAQRKANVEKALQSQTQKAAEPTQAAEPAPIQPAPTAQPDNSMADKNVWLQHIMQGMQKFEVALANNPEMAVA